MKGCRTCQVNKHYLKLLVQGILKMMLFGIPFLGLNILSVFAQGQAPMQTLWQLAYWESYDSACTIVLDEDRTPTNEEIKAGCGEALLQTWLTTPICERNYGNQGDHISCTGVFLRRLGQRPKAESFTEVNYEEQNLRNVRFEIQNVNCTIGSLSQEKPEILLKGINPGESSSFREIYLPL